MILFWEKPWGWIGLGAWLACISGCYGGPLSRGRVVPLEVDGVYPIESEIAIEPSGLCLREGMLYSVSDDTDDTIFRLVIAGQVARFEPALTFQRPAGARGRLDLEGIALGPDGSFYLLSEGQARVFQVFPDGRSEWVTESAQSAGSEAGFFRATGAGIEGLTTLEESAFLLLVERLPRGWIEMEGGAVRSLAPLPQTNFGGELSLIRLPDFTGADRFGETVFVLGRNGELVTTLERDGAGGWREGPVAWSFGSVTRSDHWGFRDRRFGMAEGLAVDEDHFYIVLDNNGVARLADAADKRPLLLVLRR